MVVEKSVLINVVFPKPDSPATLLASVPATSVYIEIDEYHNGEGSSTFSNDFVPRQLSIRGRVCHVRYNDVIPLIWKLYSSNVSL